MCPLGGRCKRIRRGLMIIWHASIWGIWKVRNGIIFNDEVLDVESTAEYIKVQLKFQRVSITNGVGIRRNVS